VAGVHINPKFLTKPWSCIPRFLLQKRNICWCRGNMSDFQV